MSMGIFMSGKLERMIDIFIHKWLKLPYTLHAEVRQPQKKRATTIVLIHGIGASGEVWRSLLEHMPPDYRVVTIDLLGFGRSPRPSWAVYDTGIQARSVIATLLRLRAKGRLVIVGHSLGSLVAVEVTKRYKLAVKALILCSPPFYNSIDASRTSFPSSEKLLAKLYGLIKKHPDRFVAISNMALRVGLVNMSFSLTRENAAIYMNALESSILNQTALHDAIRLRTPMHIIYGRMDPVVIPKNLKLLAKSNTKVRLTSVMGSHEMTGVFVSAIVRSIDEALKKKR
jgi:pimeloyl-ACP methyl ester carboxylesterase